MTVPDEYSKATLTWLICNMCAILNFRSTAYQCRRILVFNVITYPFVPLIII